MHKKKYRVTAQYTGSVVREIEAEDLEEAHDLAEELFNDIEAPKLFNFSVQSGHEIHYHDKSEDRIVGDLTEIYDIQNEKWVSWEQWMDALYYLKDGDSYA